MLFLEQKNKYVSIAKTFLFKKIQLYLCKIIKYEPQT
jgi:hypothetical protein